MGCINLQTETKKKLTVFFHQRLEDVAQQPVISLGQISIIPKPESFGDFLGTRPLRFTTNLRDDPSWRHKLVVKNLLKEERLITWICVVVST